VFVISIVGWSNPPMELFPQVQLIAIKLLIFIVYILDTNACGECCVDDYVITMGVEFRALELLDSDLYVEFGGRHNNIL
jgi:hypothetical protein